MTHLYRGSDGGYYTDYGICRRFESGAWSACMWDEEAGWEVVETGDGGLLRLNPVEPAELARESEGDHRADPASNPAGGDARADVPTRRTTR